MSDCHKASATTLDGTASVLRRVHPGLLTSPWGTHRHPRTLVDASLGGPVLRETLERSEVSRKAHLPSSTRQQRALLRVTCLPQCVPRALGPPGELSPSP